MGFGGHFQQVKGNELFCEIDDNYLEKLLESVINREESHFIHQVPQHYDAAQNLANFVCECNHFCDGPCVYYHENLSYYENHICNGKSEPAHPFIYSKQEAMMYGLIHARYIMTNVGIDKMKEKYLEGEFGYCPRVYCENQPLLPVGLSDILKKCTVKMYCPKCEDLYHPRSARFHSIDGSYFGTSFPHMFLMAYPELRPKPAKFFYEPLLYGFKIHPEAKHLQLQKAEIANQSTKMEKEKGKQDHTTDDELKRTPYMIMKPQKKISKSLEMNETIDLKQIIEAYNMKLLPKYEIPFGTRKIGSIAKCDITEILDMLLLFLDTQEVSAKKIIDLVFNLDHQSPMLSMLYKYKSYKFPDNYDEECFAHLFQKPLYNMFRNNLQTLADDIKNMLKTTGDVNPQNDSVQHNTVKAILKDYFGKITEEGVLSNNGACHASLTFEQTQPTRTTTTRKKGSLYEVVAVTPDLVIGQFNGHATIPVEVYSHHTHNDDVSSPDESPALLSDEEFVSIHKFLSQEVPAFNTPKTCSDDFKKQITKQLLLQLVALTALYLGEKSEYKHRRAFLGLFAVNCNFYILKLQGYEEDFNKLGQCPTRQKRLRMKDSITVQYFPLPLDISIPHHGIALQIFLRYYRNFYKI